MFDTHTLYGAKITCGSYNFFPYRGYDFDYAAAVANEGGADFVYAGEG